MIFGFNTEVKYGDTVYHIQSEARQKDMLLQTQVFIHGRCMGKHATSYAHRIADADFSDEKMHELLKDQHKAFVVAAREGKIETLIPNLHKADPAGV